MIRNFISKNIITGLNSPFFYTFTLNTLIIMKKFLRKHVSAITWFIILAVAYFLFTQLINYVLLQIK